MMSVGSAPTLKSAVAPGAVPVLGHAWRMRRGPLEFLASLPACGDLVEVRLAGRRAYVLCHPALVRQVLADNRTFDKTGPLWDRVRDAYGIGVASCAHEGHQRLRRMVQPAFHRGRLAGHAAIMTRELEAVMSSWHDGQVLDVTAEMYEITARVAAKTMFAAEIASDAVATIREAITIHAEGCLRRVIVPIRAIDKLPTSSNRRFHAAGAQLRGLVTQIIADYRRAGIDHGDLLSMLLAAQSTSGTETELTDDELHDQVVNLLVAGSETTASTLAWTFHLLAAHPEIEHRLHTEVDAILAGRSATWEDIERLDLTGRVITEILRLWPPVLVLTRQATTDVTLAERSFPAGTTFVFSPYLLHRRSETFHSPDRFDPDRWLATDVETLNPAMLKTFGGGSRKCVGDRFATTEATLVAASIATRWRLRPVPGVKVRPRASIIVPPHGLRMSLHRRDRPANAPSIGDVSGL